MLRTRLHRLLFALVLPLVADGAQAQATLRPIPSVARAWEARPVLASYGGESGGSAVPAPAPSDLDFIGPPRVARPRPEVGDPSMRLVDFELHAEGVGSATFEGAQGEVTTLRGGWQVALGRLTPGGLSYAFELGTEASFYDFNGSPVAGVSDPFNDVYDTRLGGRFLYQVDEEFEYYGGVQVGIAGEDAVGMDDSGYVGGAVALRFNADPNFALIAGFAGMSRFDDSPWLLPYIGFDWNVTERLNLRTEAAEVHASYQLDDAWELGLEAIYDFRQFRLNEDGPLNQGSFRDEEISAGATLAWKPTDKVTLELGAGALLWREVRFSDGDAGFLGETETDSPFYASASLRVRF